MQTLTILIILAMRSIFSEALDNPEGLVQVTVGDSQYLFSPNQIIAPSRTRIQFFFYGNYSVVQSAFDTPCHPAPNAFYSGFISSSLSGPLAPITFTITLNDTHPIWFYCSQEDFCQRYMVGVINPPDDTTKNISVFAAQAALQNENISPTGGVNGGTLGLLDSSPLSSSTPKTLNTGAIQTPLFPLASEGITTIDFLGVFAWRTMATLGALLVFVMW